MKRVKPQALTWRIDVEPYPAVSDHGVGIIITSEWWAYSAYTTDDDAWQQLEWCGFGTDGAMRTLGRWGSVEALAADEGTDPPSWLLEAIRAIEATP